MNQKDAEQPVFIDADMMIKMTETAVAMQREGRNYVRHVHRVACAMHIISFIHTKVTI